MGLGFGFFLLRQKLFICISPEAVLNQMSVSGRTPSSLTPKISRRLSAVPPQRPQRAGGGAAFNELSGQRRSPDQRLTPASAGLGLPAALEGGCPRSPAWVGGFFPARRRGHAEPSRRTSPQIKRKRKTKQNKTIQTNQTPNPTRVLLEEKDFPVFKRLWRGGMARSDGDNAWHGGSSGAFPEPPYMEGEWGGGPPRAGLRGRGGACACESCFVLHVIVCHSR